MMSSTAIRTAIVAAGVLMHAGCGGLRTVEVSPAAGSRPQASAAQMSTPAEAPPQPTLEETIGKMRRLMAEARPPVRGTAASYDEVAAIYYQRGLLDRLHDYSNRSLRLDPARAAAHERLARIWRDRSISRGAERSGMLECRIALEMSPQLTAARNNLALTYAAADRPDLARREFALAAGPAATAYNMGVVYMALKRFDDDAGEFAMAHAMSPPLTEAARRAGEARRRASEEVDIRRGN